MGSGPKDGPVGLAPDTRFTTTSRRTAPFTNSRRTVLVPPRGSLMADAAAELATHQRSPGVVGVGTERLVCAWSTGRSCAGSRRGRRATSAHTWSIVAVLAIDLLEPSLNATNRVSSKQTSVMTAS